MTGPDVGSAGTLNGGATFVASRYGNGALLDAIGENVSFDATGFDAARGAVEFWYRPSLRPHRWRPPRTLAQQGRRNS